MDARRLWNLAVSGASAWLLGAATGATANTLDGDLTYAKPDRGETVHRVPANNTGTPEASVLSYTNWSAGGGGFSLPGNASVNHRGSGSAPLYEAVSGDRSYPAPSFAPPPTAEPAPAAAPRRTARVTPPADPSDEEEQETDPPAQPSAAAATQILAAITPPPATEDGPLPFVDDQTPPEPEAANAPAQGGEPEIRQALLAPIEIAAVPEPVGLGILGAGLVALGWLRRRVKA